MTPTEAATLLNSHGLHTPWVRHCHQVAAVADYLAKPLLNAGVALDRDLLACQALLHDIGRSKTHGPGHGWAGYILLRSTGNPEVGRGCLTHWLKGRELNDLEGHFASDFIGAVDEALQPSSMLPEDIVLSVADSSVQHDCIVPLADRHEDLFERYGRSPWLEKSAALAASHLDWLGEQLDRPAETLLEPLFGTTFDERNR